MGKWFELKEGRAGIKQVRRHRKKFQAQKTRAESPRQAEHGPEEAWKGTPLANTKPEKPGSRDHVTQS